MATPTKMPTAPTPTSADRGDHGHAHPDG
jgi:hypothetical protein